MDSIRTLRLLDRNTDPLTELLNRCGLETELLVEVRRMAQSGAPLAAVLIDCDDFKRINETLGYAGGDAVLKRVAERLSESLRPSDHIGRIDGDEFLVLLPDTRLAEAFRVGQRLRLSIARLARDLASGPCPISASLGIELVPDGSGSIAEILVGTERALQQSKLSGKNRVSSLDSAASEDASHLDDLVSWARRGGAAC
jgi:diguanylate cyclase (GGDEF)-like protein